jgi:hypothetical protein
VHAEIASVRLQRPGNGNGKYAWLVFNSESAYNELQKAKLSGKTLIVDHCGTKARNPEQQKRDRPVNPTVIFPYSICIDGLFAATSFRDKISSYDGL